MGTDPDRLRKAYAERSIHDSPANLAPELTIAVGILLGGGFPGTAAALIVVWEHWAMERDGSSLPPKIESLVYPPTENT